MVHRTLRASALIAICLAFAAPTWAQGLLVNTQADEHVRLPRPVPTPMPQPPAGQYKVGSIDVQARIVEQVARVQVAQSFVNTGSVQMEVSFLFPLPYDGAIDEWTLLVDGQEFPGRLLARSEARRIYEEIVRKNRDPALLEWMGTGMFQTSVFPVPPGATRQVTLRYTQLCRKDQGLTDFLFPLSTARYTSQPIDTLRVRISIESQSDIQNVYSPTHAVEVKREKHRATVVYEARHEVPASDFRLFYDVGRGRLAARVLTYRPAAGDDGYFLLLASPEIRAASDAELPKAVVFAVDRSGSMSGAKIEQAKAALRFVLNNLRPGDVFNIVVYDSGVESFRPELQKFDDESREAALGFIDGIYAGGGTNIDGALATALSQLEDARRPSYVIFLTDGLPTVGEQNETKIVAHARQANRARARVLAFGVGYDLNSRLLDKLVRENYGQSEYVRPNEDIEAHVARLYRKISAPVMTDVAIEYQFDEAQNKHSHPVSRTYPKAVFDLFEGEQIVVVGRYKTSGAARVRIVGRVGDEQQQFDFPAEFAAASRDESQAFIEKLWAARRIGEIIDELDLRGRNEELVRELVELSTRHGILTPYTAFLADENTRLSAVKSNATTAERRLEALADAEGEAGVAQRSAKFGLQSQSQAPAAASAPALNAGNGVSGRYIAADKDEMVVCTNVRQVGNKSFFLRGGNWVDSTCTDEMAQRARRIEQYSTEYFALAAEQGAGRGAYFTFDEPVLLNLDGTAYWIEAATTK